MTLSSGGTHVSVFLEEEKGGKEKREGEGGEEEGERREEGREIRMSIKRIVMQDRIQLPLILSTISVPARQLSKGAGLDTHPHVSCSLQE